jgi:hypothetical protein
MHKHDYQCGFDLSYRSKSKRKEVINMGLGTFSSLSKEEPAPVKKRFVLMFQVGDKFIGFTPIGPPHHITKPITKKFKGVAYTYLCTDDGSVYSAPQIDVFEKEGD